MRERTLIDRLLKPLAGHPAARGLADDAAVLAPPLGRDLVFTHDVLACGIHYLPADPASDIAWKLLAVNLSDLAAMGARPVGVLMGLALSATEDEAWLTAFTGGLKRALDRWEVPLLGGDTVTGLDRAVLGLTAIGQVPAGGALARGGAKPGDDLYVTGTIGDAGLGLAIAKGEAPADKFLLNRFRRPEPRLATGAGLVGLASAAMDVSDGLLIDAERLAAASGVAVDLDLAALPLSDAAAARTARSNEALVERATAGDDYELLFAVAPVRAAEVATLAEASRLRLTRIGAVAEGKGLKIAGIDGETIRPSRLGYEHGT
ncbi:thiamine-phosphate kinase [Sphingoaurantiacus capsulatus]|uniref:Thiamine-monophosphate kinase n=1 Tax=Sphingoaurantiacus capsulatus TaxID=1771310 RepID=A0ABV7XC74_9SPHN